MPLTKTAKKSRPDAPGPSPKRRAYGTFRPRPEDRTAAERVLQLLELEGPSQVLRLSLHHLLATVEACDTPEQARAMLRARIEAVKAIRRGGGRGEASGPEICDVRREHAAEVRKVKRRGPLMALTVACPGCGAAAGDWCARAEVKAEGAAA